MEERYGVKTRRSGLSGRRQSRSGDFMTRAHDEHGRSQIIGPVKVRYQQKNTKVTKSQKPKTDETASHTRYSHSRPSFHDAGASEKGPLSLFYSRSAHYTTPLHRPCQHAFFCLLRQPHPPPMLRQPHPPPTLLPPPPAAASASTRLPRPRPRPRPPPTRPGQLVKEDILLRADAERVADRDHVRRDAQAVNRRRAAWRWRQQTSHHLPARPPPPPPLLERETMLA